jgi:hypothetical protein
MIDKIKLFFRVNSSRYRLEQVNESFSSTVKSTDRVLDAGAESSFKIRG